MVLVNVLKVTALIEGLFALAFLTAATFVETVGVQIGLSAGGITLFLTSFAAVQRPRLESKHGMPGFGDAPHAATPDSSSRTSARHRRPFPPGIFSLF